MSKPILTHLGTMPIAQFLAEYWQKKPLLIRNAVSQIPQLDPDTLAGFSLEEGVHIVLYSPLQKLLVIIKPRPEHSLI